MPRQVLERVLRQPGRERGHRRADPALVRARPRGAPAEGGRTAGDRRRRRSGRPKVSATRRPSRSSRTSRSAGTIVSSVERSRGSRSPRRRSTRSSSACRQSLRTDGPGRRSGHRRDRATSSALAYTGVVDGRALHGSRRHRIASSRSGAGRFLRPSKRSSSG